MALTRLATPVAGDIISPTTHYITEFDNIYTNALTLISPLTGTLNVNSNQLTNLRVENVTATPAAAAAGRVVWHTTYKQWQVDDGVQIRYTPAIYGSTGPNQMVVATSPHQFGLGPKINSTTGSCVWPAFNAAATISTTIALSGAAVGDVVLASHSALTMASVLITGRVTTSGTITVDIYNGTGAALNPGSGTLRVVAISYA
jgi:hypothetical protein